MTKPQQHLYMAERVHLILMTAELLPHFLFLFFLSLKKSGGQAAGGSAKFECVDVCVIQRHTCITCSNPLYLHLLLC